MKPRLLFTYLNEMLCRIKVWITKQTHLLDQLLNQLNAHLTLAFRKPRLLFTYLNEMLLVWITRQTNVKCWHKLLNTHCFKFANFYTHILTFMPKLGQGNNITKKCLSQTFQHLKQKWQRCHRSSCSRCCLAARERCL